MWRPGNEARLSQGLGTRLLRCQAVSSDSMITSSICAGLFSIQLRFYLINMLIILLKNIRDREIQQRILLRLNQRPRCGDEKRKAQTDKVLSSLATVHHAGGGGGGGGGEEYISVAYRLSELLTYLRI